VYFDYSVMIRRSPDAVYAYLADVQDHAHAPGSPVCEMVKSPPGPTRAGTCWREVVRLAPLATITMLSEVTAADPGRRLAMTFRGPAMRGDLTYSLQPVERGTVLRQQESLTLVRPLRVLSRPVARMLGPRLADRLQDIRQQLQEDTVTA
jgi:hypothetical protein